jgi:peptidyl-prolyl cis-trans isomerase A (cyclophilin A)
MVPSPVLKDLLQRTTSVCIVLGLLSATAACSDKAAPPPESSAVAVAGGAAAPATAPDSFRITFETSRGKFVTQINRAWAPLGADRIYELAKANFFDDQRFFRVVPGFVAQFGINDKPAVNEPWDKKPINDDPVQQSNKRGTLVFATMGPRTRNHQFFINLVNNANLDGMGFVPLGRVVEGMDVVDSLYSGYGESPDQTFIQTLGNSYLTRTFPKLDYIKAARIDAKP